jgi:hypothetical protein
MKCSICGFEIATPDQAIDEGWIPSFYDGEIEHEYACPGCTISLLQMGEDGEMEVKEEYRGKIVYQDEKPKNHMVVGVMLR